MPNDYYRELSDLEMLRLRRHAVTEPTGVKLTNIDNEMERRHGANWHNNVDESEKGFFGTKPEWRAKVREYWKARKERTRAAYDRRHTIRVPTSNINAIIGFASGR